jgi:uncharacterized protein with NAD-binding domain and iron-sulfur cluster
MVEQYGKVSRRTILRGTAAAGALTAGGLGVRAVPAAAATGRRVAVFGGGVAGMTAAHELAERGFEVTVYEPRALGGKARSIAVPGTARGGRPDLPGEHGFRFFPGFYHHIPDTMRRIPFPGNANGVWDNLVAAAEARFSRSGGPDTFIPMGPGRTWSSPDDFRQTIASVIATSAKMPMTDAAYFAERLLVFMTSCDARRLGQWENVAWRDFLGTRGHSQEFRVLLSHTLTTLLVAAKDDRASTRTIGSMGEQFLGNPLEIGDDGPLDRLLNGPTSQVWIDPWAQRLRELGVRFVTARLRRLEMRDRRISGARVADPAGRESAVTADHFVMAVPADVARQLWTPEILAVRPELAAMNRLVVDQMSGIQFYLRRPSRIARGHVAYVDSPWSLTSISQNQFWSRTPLSTFGDGTVRDCLSVDVSNWSTPGLLYGKPARECTHEQIAREVWAQIQAHLGGKTALPESDLHSWFLDSGVTWDPARQRNSNADPLLINTVGSWSARPDPHGALENLFLAGDYVRTTIDLATMEGACESARRAVNALLDTVGSNAPRCALFPLYRSPALEPFRQLDASRYAAGQPNAFDTRP